MLAEGLIEFAELPIFGNVAGTHHEEHFLFATAGSHPFSGCAERLLCGAAFGNGRNAGAVGVPAPARRLGLLSRLPGVPAPGPGEAISFAAFRLNRLPDAPYSARMRFKHPDLRAQGEKLRVFVHSEPV